MSTPQPVAVNTLNGEIADEKVLVRANRSLSYSGLRKVLLGFGVAALWIACLAATQGNYFAPVFAALDIAVVVTALLIVWHLGDAADSIAMEAGSVVIEKQRGTRTERFVFNPAWVRCECNLAKGGRHLLVCSHGDAVELGSFLNDEQRETLLKHVRALLRLARERCVPTLEG
jgi:uncharacterized membrane protein